MKRFALISTLALAACHSSVDDFRSGVPSKDQVTLNVPGAAHASIGRSQDALQGQTSDFYVLTRVATVIVNGGAAAWLDLLKNVVSNPPTSSSGNSMTWGPSNDPLSANVYKLVVSKTGSNQFHYQLDAKAKGADDSTFIAIITGDHAVTGHDFGQGTFLVNWDAAATLPQHDQNVGQANFSYSRDVNTGVATVDTDFTNVRDPNTGNLLNAKYAYTSDPGVFQFQELAPDNSGGTVRWSIESRWTQTGAGRADARAVQGTNTATASDCWDSNFVSRFEAVSFNTDPSDNYGNEATDCPFASAQYSTLP